MQQNPGGKFKLLQGEGVNFENHGRSSREKAFFLISCHPWLFKHQKVEIEKEYSPRSNCRQRNRKHVSSHTASMYSEIQSERPDIGNIMTHPDYLDGNPDLIKPKKLLNPVRASKSHQELHRELLMNHRRGVESKPELQRVLEHRRRNQLLKQRKEEDEAKKLKSPFEQELLKRQQKLDELEREDEKQEENAPEFIKVKENLRRTSTLPGAE
ncbi:PREDICTED: protein FAM107A [Thamnophis sirtalis]|uniref:Actin-associated protein FAM107A n=1 Tax=Thamnophis sirtalis TaxID=35019 RepID=A0A6I9YJW9_9SAUR|nr:PREDICTED: protein FAM107A [Thamnophis sirtalis]